MDLFKVTGVSMDQQVSTSLNSRDEITKCAESFVYFCENYVKIHHPLKGLLPFQLHGFQKRYIKALEENRFVISKKFRQGGFTTITLVWFLWRCLFKHDERIMTISKTDRDAASLSRVVRQIIDCLPDFLKPKLERANDYNIEFEETNSRIMFHKPEATRGLALNYLYLDEPAFFKDMDQHWKAMYPCLSTGGNCIAISTVNGKSNWFHKTYMDAVEQKNSFHVFHCEYTEHPEFTKERTDQLRKNLGEIGWKQEMLCEFDPKIEEQKGFYIVGSVQEEIEILKKIRQKALDEGKNPHQVNSFAENNEPAKLMFDNDNSRYSGVGLEHIERPNTFSSYFWPDVAEEIAEEHIFVNKDYALDKCIEKKKQNLCDIENRVNEIVVSDDLLVMAGILSEQESDSEHQLPENNVSQELLEKINELGNFPESLKISFSEKRFCVNGAPTNIGEFNLVCLYNGMIAFLSHEKAITKIAKLIYKKMTPLFGMREDQQCQTITSE